MKPIYLDYNASTPIAPAVLEEMLPYLREKYGNPSSSHVFGTACRAGIEQARERVANLLQCDASEIIFTSGATESNNMVIKGAAAGLDRGGRFITSSIEHPAVIEPYRHLERQGHQVTYLRVDRYGTVSPESLRRAITPDTRLISIMHANNEVGTLQPISELASIAASAGIPFHSDAAQSAGKVHCRVDQLGVDFLSIAGHKFYAPKGVGALYIRSGRKLPPLLHGAGHERGLRPGTENTASIVGLGSACLLAAPLIESEGRRLVELGRRLLDGLRQAGFSAHLNGHPENKLPNTWNISFTGYDVVEIMEGLTGIAVSAGAACHGDAVEPSPVLTAMDLPADRLRSAIRFSFGRETTERDIDAVIEMLKRNLKSQKGIHQ